MPPLVSIIVNSFNYAPYVGTAIESVLGQGYERIEVIVVDDGSTDGSADVIAGYQDRAQTLLKPNGGQASALNAGFAASTGDIVIFVDSDDLLYPHAVSSVVAAWVPECAKVQYRLAIVDEHCRPTGGSFPASQVMLPSGDLLPMIAAAGRLSVSCHDRERICPRLFDGAHAHPRGRVPSLRRWIPEPDRSSVRHGGVASGGARGVSPARLQQVARSDQPCGSASAHRARSIEGAQCPGHPPGPAAACFRPI